DHRDAAFEALATILNRAADKAMFATGPNRDEYTKWFTDALLLYERIAEKSQSDPAGWQEAARAYQQVGVLYRALQRDDKALEAVNKGVASDEKGVALARSAAARQRLRGAHWELACDFRELRRQEEAERAFRRTLAVSRQLVQERPNDVVCRGHLAEDLLNL